MKSRYLRTKLTALSQIRGVLTCVLIDADTGLIWETSDAVDLPEAVAETASDFWRLYLRLQPTFADMGALQSIVLQHDRRELRLTGCGRGVVLLTVTLAGTPVDEALLARKARELGELVER
jgi:hypothetical protein